ncbi:hypothetical protein EF918_18515 [Streptomyces sp. WAC06614]|nr:hypothetical protein EF918_18515 [Streptomyces sp. WAC06614]
MARRGFRRPRLRHRSRRRHPPHRHPRPGRPRTPSHGPIRCGRAAARPACCAGARCSRWGCAACFTCPRSRSRSPRATRQRCWRRW